MGEVQSVCLKLGLVTDTIENSQGLVDYSELPQPWPSSHLVYCSASEYFQLAKKIRLERSLEYSRSSSCRNTGPAEGENTRRELYSKSSLS